MAKRANLSKAFVWVILVLLIVGLAGFGATTLTGTIRTIGNVGDKYIDVEDYGRALQQEIRAAEAQTGQSFSFAQVQAIGLDRAVLTRLVTTRALDNEAAQLGISIGDENLSEQIVRIPAFTGLDGQFDREGYRFTLEQQGLSEAQFEIRMRDETARTLMQAAMVTGVSMPSTFSDTLIGFIAERRSFTWTTLDRASLGAPLPEASEEEITAHYEQNIDRFSLPETKQISYVLLTPDMILDQVEVDEVALGNLFDERSEQYNKPERRLVERLAFSDETAANDAKAALEVAGTTFEVLVEDRDLTLSDIDLGDVTQTELDTAGDMVFAADVGDIVGPAPSPLGPALFRINGVLPAVNTSFDDARAELQVVLAADRARRLIESQATSIDDLLAGGATLEEVAADTDMEFDKIDWFTDLGEGIAAYANFEEAARALAADDFAEVIALEDGGIFAMQLDNVLPQRPAPLVDVRRDVVADWDTEQLETRLRTQAEALLPQIQNGADFAELALDAIPEENLIRSDFVAGTPPAFMSRVFEMEPGEADIVDSDGAVLIVRLDAIAAPEDTAEITALYDGIQEQTSQALAQDIFDIFARDVQLRGNPQIDQRAVNAVNASFQ